MKYKLFSELDRLYQASNEKTNVIRMEIQMKDRIDGTALRHAADTTMKRFPYFAVKLLKEADAYYFTENKRPVPVINTEKGVTLNSEASGYHLLAFSWTGNTIYVDVFHALTDGTGVYALIRTLLYYYCTEYYHEPLSSQGLRLLGDPITAEEWDDPCLKLADIPAANDEALTSALNLLESEYAGKNWEKTVFSISLDESEYMAFSSAQDGSPGVITALLFSHAVASVHPDAKQPVRIFMCVNQRKAMQAPLAHQSLVGGVWLEIKEKMRTWPLDRQATAFRGMVFAQTLDEKVLANRQAMNRKCGRIRALKDDAARAAFVKKDDAYLSSVITATVSYVGRANFGAAESFVTGFRTLAFPMVEGILIEISAVNHRINLDIIQNFSSPAYKEALLRVLEKHGIPYYDQGSKSLYIPGIRLPWLTDTRQ